MAGVATLARVAYLATALRDYEPASDAHHYYSLGLSVAHGDGLSAEFPFPFEHATGFRPPLFPMLLGAVLRVAGDRLLAGMVLTAALGVAVAVLVSRVAGRVSGPRAGLIAGLLAACYPPLLFNDGTVLSESLSHCLLLATLLAVAYGRAPAGGLAAGLLTLARASAQAFVLPLALWAMWRRGLRWAAVFSGVAVLTVVPWVARNWVQVGDPTLVTSNGFNLAAVYSDEAIANGGFVDPYNDPPFEGLRYMRYTEAELDDALRGVALDDVGGDPSRVADVAWRNAGLWLELTPARNELAESLDGRPIRLRRAALPMFYAVTLLGMIGLVTRRRDPMVQILLLTAGWFTLMSLVGVAVPRLRGPFDVAMCVGVGLVASRRAPGVGAAACETAARETASTPTAERPRGGTSRPRRPTSRRALATSALLVGLVAPGSLALAAVARDTVGDRACDALRGDLGGMRGAVRDLAAAYPVDPAASELRRVEGHDRILALEEAMWAELPKLSRCHRAQVRVAAESLHEARSQYALLGLMLIDETEASGASATVGQLRNRYDAGVASGNPSLVPWDDLLAGTAAADAERAVHELAEALGVE